MLPRVATMAQNIYETSRTIRKQTRSNVVVGLRLNRLTVAPIRLTDRNAAVPFGLFLARMNGLAQTTKSLTNCSSIVTSSMFDTPGSLTRWNMV